MFDRSRFRNLTSLLLVLLLVFATMPAPVSASNIPSPTSSLGSVSGTGTVEVRGVAVRQEGTLFPGDRVRTGSKSYAKVILVNGNKVELSSDTAFTVNRANQEIRLEVTSGGVAFTASQNPIAIVIGKYEIVPQAGSSGTVAFTGSNLAGVHMLKGSAILRDMTNKASVSVSQGSERLVSLPTVQAGALMAKVASAGPVPLPQAAAGGAAAASTTAGMSTLEWVALAGILGGVGASVGVLVTENPTPASQSTPTN
jgi:hypothetical protein